MKVHTNFESPFSIEYEIDNEDQVTIVYIALYDIPLKWEHERAFIKDYGLTDIERLCLDDSKKKFEEEEK